MRNLLLTLMSADTSPVTILKNLKIYILKFKFSKEGWMNEDSQIVLLSYDISSNVYTNLHKLKIIFIDLLFIDWVIYFY